MARFSELLNMYGFVRSGDRNLVNYYARMKDGGLLSISLAASSYCTPRALLAADDYDEVEIAFLRNGDPYNPGFLADMDIRGGILAYFPVKDFEALTRRCFGAPDK
jgi:hypothetical protein